jgi:hypothetical protein
MNGGSLSMRSILTRRMQQPATPVTGLPLP